MSQNVTSAHKGHTQIFTLTTYDEEDLLTDADGSNAPSPWYPVIVIKKGETEFTPDVVNEEMTRSDLGTYKYYWDTTPLSTGRYNVEIDWDMKGLSQHLEIVQGVTD